MKGIGAGELGVVALVCFLFASSAPSRVYAAMQWMRNNLQLPLPLAEVIPPSKTDVRRRPRGQAACVEPGMVRALEYAIVNKYESNSPSWVGLLGAWLMTFGGLRLRHLKRSTPVRLTETTFYAVCARGKQRHNRGGFEWSIPSHFVAIPERHLADMAEVFLAFHSGRS